MLPRLVKRLACIVLLAWSTVAAAGGAFNEHLLAGASHFRAGRYEAALVELQVAEKLGAGAQARWYIAATLSKLGRPEDALEAFLSAAAGDPGMRDVLLTYHEAVASQDARLYARADRLLSSVGSGGGPAIAEFAAKLRAQLAPLLQATPTHASVDWYLDRVAANRAGRPRLAALFAEEAARVAHRTPDCYRCADADKLAGALAAGGSP